MYQSRLLYCVIIACWVIVVGVNMHMVRTYLTVNFISSACVKVTICFNINYIETEHVRLHMYVSRSVC